MLAVAPELFTKMPEEREILLEVLGLEVPQSVDIYVLTHQGSYIR